MKRVNLAGLLDGHYLVKDKKFQNKIEALRYASQFPELKDSDIKYLWNHDVWNNFDKSLLGKISLKELYRERAQQIKDQYDYLILYYSGGSDSHNILRTFLDNKIKLDEVVVKWPKKVVGTDLYTPNTIDRTARNFVSEWDFVIEKELNNLKLNHPDIKITVLDFMEDATPDYYTDDIFLNMNHMHSAINLLRMPCYTEMEMNPKGKRVVGITGLDKPLLAKKGDDVFMFFSDDILNSQPRAAEAFRENFYWSIDLPILPFEMAYQCFLYFKANSHERFCLLDNSWEHLPYTIKFDSTEYYWRTIKHVIYGDTWDNAKFQAEKPFHGFKADKDFWFYDSPEYAAIKDRWFYYYQSQLSSIDARFCHIDELGKKSSYKKIATPYYKIGSWTQNEWYR
jgi:hypothetical protein